MADLINQKNPESNLIQPLEKSKNCETWPTIGVSEYLSNFHQAKAFVIFWPNQKFYSWKFFLNPFVLSFKKAHYCSGVHN